MTDELVNPAARSSQAARKRRQPLPGLLRRIDAARYYGVGASTWDRLTAAGLTPAAIRIGGSVAWSSAELAEWCRRRCPPRDEWEIVWAALLQNSTRKGSGR